MNLIDASDFDCGKSLSLVRFSIEEYGLDLGVEDENESTSSASKDVGKGSLEESLGTLVGEDSLEAVGGTSVHLLGSSGVHHESSSDGIKRVGDDAGTDSDDLSEAPHSEDVSLLGIWEHQGLTGIEHTEVGGAIEDDTNDGDTETSVETLGTFLSCDRLEAVNESSELTISAITDVSSETCSGEIEGVDGAEGGGTSSSTRGAVTEEELDGFDLGVVRVEDFLVIIFEGEVQSLGGEITNDVGQVTSPEGTESLLLDDSLETVTDTVVSIFNLDLGRCVLNLQEELNSLDGGDKSLGNSGGNTTDHEIGDEGLLAFLRGSGSHDDRIFDRLSYNTKLSLTLKDKTSPNALKITTNLFCIFPVML